ncbi:MAG TPA: hypothetical protein DCP31_18185, partial [Cyanobacteria bacterium UBA8543]|nr:hypothetical protein [Cyanobacteria bacterium UBA8543]
RAEAALRESEEKYRVLFETMDEGYLLSEVIFDENDKPIDILYLEANPAAVRLAGRDFSGQRMREIDPNYEEYWYEIYGRVALTGESMRAERYAEPHDRWFDFYAFKVGGQESRRVAIVFNDITAAKHREAERKRTEEQQTFLLKFSDMLRAEPDADSIANQAVRMLAEHLRLDRFWLSEVFEQQGISTVGPEYHRPDLPPMSGVFRLSDYPETMRQLATQPMVIHDVVNDPGFSDSEKAILSQLHLRSLQVASLREGQHQVIWALAAAMTTPRHWNESERVLLEKVSEFVWAAIGRARVEAALRESEAKYRTLFESIDQGYCLVELILNQEGKPIDWLYLEANPSYQRQTGLGDIVGKRLLEFVPNLEPEWFDFYGNVAQTGEPARLEYPVEAIGRWFTVYASRVGGEGSLLVAIVFEDITDRKRTETNLAFLAEISQDLVHLTNIDETMDAIGAKIGGHFHVARVIFSEISEDQETGRVSHEWHQPDLPDMKGTYATKAYFSPEFERLHRAGEIAVVRDTAKDQRVDGERYAVLGVGAFVGVPLIRQDKWRFYFSLLDSEPRHWRDDEIELLRELTTRIWTRLESARAEAALRESEARRHLAIEAAELGTFLYHPQEDRGEPDARMLALFGLGEGDTLNLAEAIANMIHPDDRELYAAAVATAVNPNGDGKFYAEIRVLHPDKSLHWVAVTAQTVFEGEPPQPVRMYGIAADITDRKQAEADRIQLIQEQANRLEAERMSQMKDEFVAMISHELQSPMVAVLGWTRLLRANLPPPAMLMKHLETIERNAMLQAKLIQDLLDISRISAGKLRLRLEPVELESAIETAIAAVLTAAIVKNISIQHPSTDRAVASVLVMGDRDRLQQVFCNLLTNAIKFTSEGGSVTIELSTIKAEKPKSAPIAEIQFVDTGIGISEDFLPHVFDRFHQAEKSGSAGGLGLGLAIALHIVELHSGTIHATSEGVGQGATFIVKLPLRQVKS